MVKICNNYSASVSELSISIDGVSFLCLCGHHINGAYISFIDAGVSAELSPHKDDFDYNAGKILEALGNSKDGAAVQLVSIPKEKLRQKAKEIAEVIAPYIEMTEGEQMSTLRQAMGAK